MFHEQFAILSEKLKEAFASAASTLGKEQGDEGDDEQGRASKLAKKGGSPLISPTHDGGIIPPPPIHWAISQNVHQEAWPEYHQESPQSQPRLHVEVFTKSSKRLQ